MGRELKATTENKGMGKGCIKMIIFTSLHANIKVGNFTLNLCKRAKKKKKILLCWNYLERRDIVCGSTEYNILQAPCIQITQTWGAATTTISFCFIVICCYLCVLTRLFIFWVCSAYNELLLRLWEAQMKVIKPNRICF